MKSPPGRLESGSPRRARPSPDPERSGLSDGNRLESLFQLLRDATGIDFSGYRRTFVARQVEARIRLLGLESARAYESRLRDDPAEVAALRNRLLITVTQFFRDPGAFAVLRREVLPALIRHRPWDDPLRIWVAGCSSGEEAYAIGICALECFEEFSREVPCTIFATDVHEQALARARAGAFPPAIRASVSEDRIKRFFAPCEGGFRVLARLRRMCYFAKHDVTKDPPYGQLDLISCRNVLIFMETELQERVLKSFHFGLKSGGYLFLGQHETAGAFSPLFSLRHRDAKIYSKNPVPAKPAEGLARESRAGPSPRPELRVQF